MKLFLSLILVGFTQTSFALNIQCNPVTEVINDTTTISSWNLSTWPLVEAINLLEKTTILPDGSSYAGAGMDVVSGIRKDQETVCYRQFDVFNKCTITQSGMDFTVYCAGEKSVTMLFGIENNVGYLSCLENSQLKKTWVLGSCHKTEDKK